MAVAVRGKRAKGFGIAGFFVFAGTYGMYIFSTIRSIVGLSAWEPFSLLKPSYISLFIELLFFLGMVYLCVDGGIKYFKEKPTGTFPHAIRLVMVYAIYSFLYPIYNKFLRPEHFGGFELIDLVTTTTGISLMVSIAFSISSLFLANKSKPVRHVVFGGAFFPIILLDALNIVWNVAYYGEYWMYDQHLLIFGPILRLVSYILFIAAYFFEKKDRESAEEGQYTAYCGLNCKECEAYKATIEKDDVLRAKVAEEWSKLNGVEITPSMIDCEGCKLSGKKTPYAESLCEVRKCAAKKEIGLCADCLGYASCKKVEPFKKPLDKEEKTGRN